MMLIENILNQLIKLKILIGIKIFRLSMKLKILIYQDSPLLNFIQEIKKIKLLLIIMGIEVLMI